jgi:hypothetical protein
MALKAKLRRSATSAGHHFGLAHEKTLTAKPSRLGICSAIKVSGKGATLAFK